jgi:hypothetical protein
MLAISKFVKLQKKKKIKKIPKFENLPLEPLLAEHST